MNSAHGKKKSDKNAPYSYKIVVGLVGPPMATRVFEKILASGFAWSQAPMRFRARGKGSHE